MGEESIESVEKNLRSIDICRNRQARRSLIMNSGVAMKYGNESPAELSEVSGFSALLYSLKRNALLLGFQSASNAIKN